MYLYDTTRHLGHTPIDSYPEIQNKEHHKSWNVEMHMYNKETRTTMTLNYVIDANTTKIQTKSENTTVELITPKKGK